MSNIGEIYKKHKMKKVFIKELMQKRVSYTMTIEVRQVNL